ncbi:DUF4139 domain-containing protein [Mucilaginibacter segetis]|uniref:Mucoidy inhibitor MuiA family protein n=1 Tax=Mucilaginibacter segetis TaxID=2793071 RepID=A0A934UL79_9SPHI|nr:DUF4139 domain-containing protein [Mucilaginibacter segetis]MBK0378248.1 mucoidy inhibitor MuiA family protein [Mucilaginibacter segetis]
MKRILFIAALFIYATATHADDGQKIASKVQKVTVFLTGAQITRTAAVNIGSGTSTLIFENISPDIDVQSIQVKAAGEFTILSVKHEMNYLNEQLKQKQVQELQAQQKVLRDKIALQTSMLNIYEEEATMLTKNQMIAGQSGLDLVKLKQALDFQTERLTELKKKQQAVNNEIAYLNTELQKYDKQIADITKGSTTATSNILVTVSSKAVLQSVFTLTYVVDNAGWYPTYDIRAKDVNSPVTISYKANVSQHSGEEWKNIKLTLSTGNPTVSGSKPQLTPNFLSLNMYYAPPAGNITKVTGRVVDQSDGSMLPGVTVKVLGTSIGTVTDAGGNYSLQVPGNSPTLEYAFIGYESTQRPVTSADIDVALKPSAQQLNDVVVVGYETNSALSGKVAGVQIRGNSSYSVATIPVAVNQTENQTNVEFNIDNPYTIPSDGKQYLVEINEVKTDATYQYYVAPKLSSDVFLTARITDWNKYNFLSGEANLFFEGTFIGKSLLDTHATADTLNLSLGTDKNIVVTRTLQKEMNGKQYFGSNKKETRDWLITVKNRKNQPVNLLVEDQVPVSQSSDIDVDVQETSGAEVNKLIGALSWNLALQPQDEKQLRLKYQVKYPKDKSVIVQ